MRTCAPHRRLSLGANRPRLAAAQRGPEAAVSALPISHGCASGRRASASRRLVAAKLMNESNVLGQVAALKAYCRLDAARSYGRVLHLTNSSVNLLLNRIVTQDRAILLRPAR